MRIGYLVPHWPEQTHAFFWREITALRTLGHSVHAFSTTRPPQGACQHKFADEARRTTHYLYPPRASASARILATRAPRAAAALSYAAGLPESSAKDRVKVAALLGSASDLAAKCEELSIDHLHVHSCANSAHLVAMTRILGGPTYSLTLHGDLLVYGTDHRKKMEGAGFVSVVTRPLQKQVLSETGLPPDRVPVIWMGVDTDRFRPLARVKEQISPFEIVTVARLNEMKGHCYALAALKRVRDKGLDVRYTIAGEGPHRQAIERTIADLRLGDAVTMPGTCSEDEVLALLERADAFVLPSFGLGEAAPVSVMEAMACGLPVICSRIGGTEDMIEDGVSGLLTDQCDVDGLATALERLASDRELCARLGSSARERAVAVFDYRATAAKLADAFART